MATLNDLMSVIAASIKIQCAGLNPVPSVFKDYPPIGKLQNLAAGTGNYFVSIFQQAPSHNKTRYMQHFNPPVITDPVIAVAASETSIPAFGTATVTLSNTPILNDAVGITVFQGNNSVGQAASIKPSSTFTADYLAEQLTNIINADPNTSPWISASVPLHSSVITITNRLNMPLMLYANAGNIAISLVQRGNEVFPILITVWTRTNQDRNTIGELLREWIIQTQFNFGLEMPDGSWVRFLLDSTRQGKDDHLNDIYRWDFIIDCDMPVLIADTYYSILYQLLTTTTSY